MGGSVDLGQTVGGALRRSVATRPRRVLLAITLLLGLLAAVAMAAAAPAGDRTFAAVMGVTQLLMSVPLPFLGALMARDLRDGPRETRVAPTILAAVLLAAVVGLYGVAVGAAALAVLSPGAAADPWRGAVTLVAGGVLVQVVAQFVGTGLGMLVRSAVVACLATIVLPLGLWAVLGAVEPLAPAQEWLTPVAAAQHLLSGDMSALNWAQWLVVVVIWVLNLNSVAVARLRRPAPRPAAA